MCVPEVGQYSSYILFSNAKPMKISSQENEAKPPINNQALNPQ